MRLIALALAIFALALAAPGAIAQTTVDSAIAVRCVNTAGNAFVDCGSAAGTASSKILDGSAAGEADVIGSAPGGTEQGLVVRNIPSGTQAVSGPLTDAQLRATPVPISGTVTSNAGSGTFTVGGTVTGNQGTAAAESAPWPVRAQRAATTAVTSVSGSASSVTCLASNGTRLGATFHNDSTATAYLKLGATASTSSFTVKLFEDSYYRVPAGYTGVVDCIWSSATGAMRVTELTP